MRFSNALTALPLLSTLAACAAATGDGSTTSDEAIVNTSASMATFVVSDPLDPLPDHGNFTGSTVNGAPTGSGDFTNGIDLGGAPMADEAAWNGTLDIPNAVAPHFPDYMSAAAAAAQRDSVVDAHVMESIFALFAHLPGAMVDPVTPTSSFAGYTPVRGRWTRTPFHFGSRGVTYADPPELTEQRERGARLYCAAREAVIHHQPQGSVTMGSQAAFSLDILGKQIDFLVVEPTATLGGPQRFVGTTKDGAQAFEVPLELGTRFTPIRGIGLPGFDEVRYPAVLTTGDSEALTVQRTIEPGRVGFGKTVTVSHADTIRSAGASMGAHDTFPLFTIGPVEIDLNLNLSMAVGGQTSDPDQRVLAVHPSGFPTSTRTGWLGVSGGVGYHDGAWGFGDLPGLPGVFMIEPEGVTQPFWTAAASGATLIRASQDDDHRFVRTSGVVLVAGLQAVLGLDFGPLQANITARGDITGGVNQDHVLTDALFAENVGGGRALPATALSVRPRVRANATFNGLDVTLTFSIDLGLYTATWKVNLLHTNPITLASYNSDDTHGWSESSAVRLGTWSTAGDPMKMPKVMSHLPQGASFESFPQSVDSCLADPTPNPPTPPPCKAQPTDNGSRPSSNLCAYTTLSDATVPQNVCANVGYWAGKRALIPALTQCTADLLSFLCEPVTHEEAGPASTTLSHITNSSTALQRLGGLIQACGTTAVHNGVEKVILESWFQQMIGFSACDANGQLIKDVVTGTGADPNKAPPVSGGGTCQ